MFFRIRKFLLIKVAKWSTCVVLEKKGKTIFRPFSAKISENCARWRSFSYGFQKNWPKAVARVQKKIFVWSKKISGMDSENLKVVHLTISFKLTIRKKNMWPWTTELSKWPQTMKIQGTSLSTLENWLICLAQINEKIKKNWDYTYFLWNQVISLHKLFL